MASAPRPDPKAVAMMSSRSDGSGSTMRAKEVVAAAVAKKAAEMKATEEATTVKVVEEVVLAKAAEAAVTRTVVRRPQR
jgi:hypothetical protein